MWEYSHSIDINATPKTIWDIWTDVENWKNWDKDIVWSKLNGPFREGVKGQLKPKNGPKASFKIITAIENKKFIDHASLPLAKLIFSHEIKEKKEKSNLVTLTHTIQIKGLLTFLFSKVIGRNLAKGLPDAMLQLKKQAESQSKSNQK